MGWRNRFLNERPYSVWQRANENDSQFLPDKDQEYMKHFIRRNRPDDFFDSPLCVEDNGLLRVITMILFPNTDPDSSARAYNMCGYEFYFSQVKYRNFTQYLGPYRGEHLEMIIERDSTPVVKIMACGEEMRLITSEEKKRGLGLYPCDTAGNKYVNKFGFYLENLITGQVWSFKEWV